jgi:hypothetical protein
MFTHHILIILSDDLNLNNIPMDSILYNLSGLNKSYHRTVNNRLMEIKIDCVYAAKA